MTYNFISNLIFRFPEFLRNRNGQVSAEVDWEAVYKLPEADLIRSVQNKVLMTCDEARETGLLRGEYFHFTDSISLDSITFDFLALV